VSFSRDATLVATSSVGRKVQVWSAETGDLVHEFEHLDRVERCVFTPDGSAIIACDHGGMIRIWKLSPAQSPEQVIPGVPDSSGWKAHPDRIYSVAVSPDAKQLLSAGADGKVLAWNLTSAQPNTELQKSDGQIVDLAFVPGRDLLATIDAHSIELWQPRDLSLVNALRRSDETFRCLAVSADGSTLATGNDAGRIEVWNVALGQPRATLHVRPDFQIDGLALSPDGSTVAVIERYVSEGDDLCVFDVASGQRLAGIVSASCNSAAFSPDGRSLFASGPANVVAVWDLLSQQKLSEQSAHVSSINRIQFSADGRLAATASDDRLVKVWTTDDWECAFVLSGHLNAVRSVAFAPDGLTLATAASDGRLKFWNLPTGQELFELKTAPVSPEMVTFSSDGRFLACLYSNPTPGSRQQLHILPWRSDRP
jgi:WD40 repeat protein